MYNWSARKERGRKKIEEIVVEKFLNLMKTLNTQVQEAQQNSRRNMKRTTQRRIKLKLLKPGCNSPK